jgi:hypothetical protein
MLDWQKGPTRVKMITITTTESMNARGIYCKMAEIAKSRKSNKYQDDCHYTSFTCFPSLEMSIDTSLVDEGVPGMFGATFLGGIISTARPRGLGES